MTLSILIPPERACEVCAAAVLANCKIKPGQPSIVSLNVTIYRRTKHGRQLVTTNRVRICEDCLGLALASQSGREIKGQILARRLFDRIAERYSAMCEAKTA